MSYPYIGNPPPQSYGGGPPNPSMMGMGYPSIPPGYGNGGGYPTMSQQQPPPPPQMMQQPPPCRLFVQNIPPTLTPAHLANTLYRYGPLNDVRILMDARGQPTSQGYCDFATVEGYNLALQQPSFQLEDDTGTTLTLSVHPMMSSSGGGGDNRGGRGGYRGGYQGRGGGGGPQLANTDLLSKQQRAVEGDLTTYVIVRCADVDTMLYSCELGWWPLAPIIAADLQDYYSRGTMEVPRPVVLVVLCEVKQKYVGYLYMTGKVTQRSELGLDKNFPPRWDTVCRVGWVRVGPLTLDTVRSHPSLLEEERRVLLTAADGSILPLPLGRQLCNLIDDSAGIKVLPNRERQRHFAGPGTATPHAHHHHHHHHHHFQNQQQGPPPPPQLPYTTTNDDGRGYGGGGGGVYGGGGGGKEKYMIPSTFRTFPAALTVLCTLLQFIAWLNITPLTLTRPGTLGKVLLSTLEMSLMYALLWNGWRICSWLPKNNTECHAVSNLVFTSLTLCTFGDVVNRNYLNLTYSYDTVVEHSYLADSVWFFLPGYATFIYASWRACGKPGPTYLIAAIILGVISFAGMVLPGTSTYVFLTTGAYGPVVTCMVPAGVWIYASFGATYVALGAVLATIADAIIGQFWLFGHGWFPGVAYLNFVVYFISQALIQQLPLTMLEAIKRPK